LVRYLISQLVNLLVSQLLITFLLCRMCDREQVLRKRTAILPVNEQEITGLVRATVPEKQQL